MEAFRYPVGRFSFNEAVTEEQRREWIQVLADAPARLQAAVEGLSAEQLNTPYRPDGWTVRQVVHHLADSHMNSYIRMKLGFTEEEPPILAYEENAWAALIDGSSAPVETSLSLLEALHTRWVMWLRSLPTAAFSRTFRHPVSGLVSLDRALALYAWHSRHHTAHITSLRQRMGW